MRDGRAIVLSDYIGGSSAASGGAGHAALDSCTALGDRGVDVRAIVGFGALSTIGPVRTTSLGGADLREQGARGAVRAVYNAQARTTLSDALAAEDPDTTVVILHQWTRYLSPAAIGALRPFRVMIYMHDYFWACPNGAYYDFREQRPCDRTPVGLRCLAADCDRGGRAIKLGRIGRAVALRAATRGWADNRLFLHLSDHAQRTAIPLLPGERHGDIRNRLDIPTCPPPAPPAAEVRYDTGYFGRLEPEKGVSMLAQATSAMGLQGLYVGQGALEATITAYAGQHHVGWRDRAEMADAMRSCRVVVLPSLWPETWGLVIPEAMAAGVPVLVSIRAGAAELVRRFGGGAVFDPGVPGDLEAKLSALLRAPQTVSADRWPEFARYLSAAAHADRIVALARSHWGIDLRPARRLPPAASGCAPVARPLCAT